MQPWIYASYFNVNFQYNVSGALTVTVWRITPFLISPHFVDSLHFTISCLPCLFLD